MGAVSISTPAGLHEALKELAHQAAQGGEADELVGALRWAAAAAVSTDQPDRREQAKQQRVLDRASGSVRATLGAIVEGVTGALTEHWLVELLRG